MQNDKLHVLDFSPTLPNLFESSHRSLSADLQKVARYLIPPHHERTPYNRSNVLYSGLPFLAVFLMAGLARRRGTWLIRLALLPVALALTLRIFFGYFMHGQYFHGINHGYGSYGIAIIALLLCFALPKRGVLKMGEISPGVLGRSSQSNGNRKQSAQTRTVRTKLISFASDALELLYSYRGIGWEFGTGTGLYVAPDWRNTADRDTYLRQTLRALAWNYIALDFQSTALRSFAGWKLTGDGRSIFGNGSNFFESYLISSVLHLMTGFFIYRGFEFTHYMLSYIGVAFRGESPSDWPPLMDRPWASESLHEFWGARWHQGLRLQVLILGGHPLQFIFRTLFRSRAAGTAGLVIGAFIASGLVHHYSFYGTGSTPGWPTILFFTAQSMGLGAERVWKALTGKRVGGWWGNLWVWLWIGVFGQWCIDSWHRCGFLSGVVIHPIVSPTQSIAVPILKRYLSSNA